LLVRPERRWSSAKVIEALADVMVLKGVPEHIRSDNGPEFVAKDLRKWLADTGAKTLYIEPGSPWENGYCESFNSKLRDEFLNGEIFYSLKEVHVLAERWRVHYNTVRLYGPRDRWCGLSLKRCGSFVQRAQLDS
jgi:transposase InsO family protein